MYGCYQSLDICAVRASVLGSDGSKTGAATNGSAYNLSPLTLSRSPIVSTGETLEQRDGCGDICVSIQDADVTTGEDLTLELCQLDLELISILTGAEVLFDGSGEVIGIDAPDPSATAPIIEFNAWSKAYNGSSPVASPRTYWHWAWPYTQWNIGDWTIERGILTVTVTGRASGNANIGSGSFNDFPGGGITQFFGVFLADDVPSADEAPYNANGLSCGFVDTPASAS